MVNCFEAPLVLELMWLAICATRLRNAWGLFRTAEIIKGEGEGLSTQKQDVRKSEWNIITNAIATVAIAESPRHQREHRSDITSHPSFGWGQIIISLSQQTLARISEN